MIPDVLDGATVCFSCDEQGPHSLTMETIMELFYYISADELDKCMVVITLPC